MTGNRMNDHFKGKKPLEHLIEARIKGKIASDEIHGAELPGHIQAAFDCAKETAFLLLILWEFELSLSHFVLFTIGYLIWKTSRSAILGWRRLERVHRLIQEERHEIEHHRDTEKEELKALYAAKGFSGKLLDEAVEVLMADDNRLLQVMLEEELGLNLESYEHPLKQGFGAFVGVLVAASFVLMALFYFPYWAAGTLAMFIISISAYMSAKLEKNQIPSAIIWNLAVAFFALAIVYFIKPLIL